MSDFSADETYDIVEKGLFVERPTRKIDLSTVPRDGHEFIHKSRLENAKLDEIKEKKYMEYKARKATEKFTYFAAILARDEERAFLKKKFPKKLAFPKNGPMYIQEWCTFCLGSKLCSEIDKEKNEEPSEEIVEGHLPFLSIIVHFNQYKAFSVLKHLHNWFLSIGMEESLGRWVYAVLVCMRRPFDSSTKELIDTFYNDCQKRLQDCDEFKEKSRLYLISALLECDVKVNSD